MKEAYIIDGVRTPIGNYKGTLGAVRTDDLGAKVIAEIVKRNPTVNISYTEIINEIQFSRNCYYCNDFMPNNP